MFLKTILLLTMLFCHIVDDYYLQGWLASAKQKSWWEKNAPDKLYKNDYIMALCEHAFSWTFMIMLIPTIYTYYLTQHQDHRYTECDPVYHRFPECFRSSLRYHQGWRRNRNLLRIDGQDRTY